VLFFKIMLCIIILLAVLLSIPFYIELWYKKNAVDNIAEVKLKIFGITITLVPSKPKKDKKEKPKKSESDDGEKEDFFEKFKIKFDNWLDAFSYIKKDIAGILDYLTRKLVVIKQISFAMIFGFDDAAINGIMTGVFNGVVYNILGFANRHITIKKWNVNINPDYYAKRFDIDTQCILRIKPVHIIVVAFKVLKIYFKLRKLSKRLNKGKE